MAVMTTASDIKRRTSRIPAPCCPVHGCKMLRYSGRTMICYVRCPVAGCGKTAKSLRA